MYCTLGCLTCVFCVELAPRVPRRNELNFKFKDDYYDYEYGEGDERTRVETVFRSRHFMPLLQSREESCFTVNLKKHDTLTVSMQVRLIKTII